MENPYAAYYTTQAGNGISGFTGSRFQRGHGFFGRIFSGILPVLKYLGKQVLGTGVSVANDALQGDNFKEALKTSTKRRAVDTFANIADDVSKRAKTYAQTGSGYKRRKRRKRNYNTTSVYKERETHPSKRTKKCKKLILRETISTCFKKCLQFTRCRV